MFSVSESLRSLVLFAWRRADHHAHELAGSLRLGLTNCRPFLTRAECARLRARLVRLEMLARRLLVLMVLEKPLPVITARCGQGAARPPCAGQPAPRPFFTTPVFRLADPRLRPGAPAPSPPLRGAAMRPRLLYLDQPLPPPEPGEYPPRPDDLVPAQALVRRAIALRDVFANPARHIARMTRRLAEDTRAPGRPLLLAEKLPAVVRSPRQDAHTREAILELQHVALRALAHADTS